MTYGPDREVAYASLALFAQQHHPLKRRLEECGREQPGRRLALQGKAFYVGGTLLNPTDRPLAKATGPVVEDVNWAHIANVVMGCCMFQA